jgi:hypothetical protein
MKLPSAVAVSNAEKNPMYKSPDPPLNAKPDLKALQAFVPAEAAGICGAEFLP